MKRSGRMKLLSILTAAALVVGALPGTALAAEPEKENSDPAAITQEAEPDGETLEAESTGGQEDTDGEDVDDETLSEEPESEEGVKELALSAPDEIAADGDVWQVKSSGGAYSSFENALKAASSGDTITLSADTTENITVTGGSKITLDLNGHTLSGDGTTSVVIIEEGAEVTLTDSGEDGCITGGSAADGGGIYNSGTLTMNGGMISGNETTEYGGGIYTSGTLTMNGGTITGNETYNTGGRYGEGGGVYIVSGSFTMNDGAINGNLALTYAAGVCLYDGTFTMYGGSISENELTNGKIAANGGGIEAYSGTTITIYDGEISGNQGALYGGGINAFGVVNLYGGTISDNTAQDDGGGIYIGGTPAELNMSGGKITGNYSELDGGGVYYRNCNTNLTGGEISGNTAGRTGGGVYHAMGSYSSYTTKLEGDVVIDGNALTSGEASNFFIEENCDYRDLSGELKEGASIGVTWENKEPTVDEPLQITSAESDTEYYKESAQYFFYDLDSRFVGLADEEENYVALGKPPVATLTQDGVTTEYNLVQKAVDAAGTEGTVTLIADCAENITIAEDQDITLDLAGYTLEGYEEGSVITNNGTLTLKDSADSGCITNGSAEEGGGVYNTGTLKMTGGTLSGNTASDCGGGIYLSSGSTFVLTGGALYGNTAGSGADLYTQGGSIALIGADEMMDAFGTDFTDYAWFDDSGADDPAEYTDAVSDDPVEVGELALVAAEKGTLTYHVGDEAKDPESHKVGASATIKSLEDFDIEENPHFSGWSESEGSETADYKAGDSYTVTTGNVDLYDVYSAHEYNAEDATFDWSEDHSTCTATVICTVCKEPAEVKCNVTSEITESCTDIGSAIYTASGTIKSREGDVTLTDVVTEEIPALGHNYDTDHVKFSWNEDNTAKATFTCTDCGYEETVDCGVTSEFTEPSCTEAGANTYTATATIDSRNEVAVTVEDKKVETIDALGHIYSSDKVVFEWSEDHTSCKATFTCTVCNVPETFDCDVTYETITEPTYTDTGSAIFTATVTVTSRDGELTVTDEQEGELAALVHDMADCSVTLGATSYTYDGSAKKPAVTVKNGSTTLENGTDYTVSYSNNTNAGTAKVTVTGMGSYSGTIEKTFTINAKNLSGTTVSLSTTSYNWDGKEKKPTVTVKNGSTTLKSGTDYSVTYPSGRKNLGTYKVTVTGKGNYTGTATKSYTISATKGKTYTVGSYKYKVTSATAKSTSGTGTVTVTGGTKKTLTSIKVSDTVKIGGRTYKVTQVGASAFKGYKKAKSITVGKNVTTIGKSAFANCTKATKVTLGASVKTIKASAFSGSKKVKTVTIKSKKLKSVGKNAIKGINKKATIKVPAKKYVTKYEKLFKSSTGFKKTMKIKK